jgi:hypothetical protein
VSHDSSLDMRAIGDFLTTSSNEGQWRRLKGELHNVNPSRLKHPRVR